MPRENRKRGKKHKKQKEDEEHHAQTYLQHEEQAEAGPSWIVHRQAEEVNPEAPFGYVDAEVKAYFRTVDLQIREWQEQGRPDVGEDEENDPNEGKLPPAMPPSLWTSMRLQTDGCSSWLRSLRWKEKKSNWQQIRIARLSWRG